MTYSIRRVWIRCLTCRSFKPTRAASCFGVSRLSSSVDIDIIKSQWLSPQKLENQARVLYESRRY
jgi:hypothetical protein